LTHSIVKENEEKRNTILSLLKEHFKRGTLLQKELECYREVLDMKSISSPIMAEKILMEIKQKHNSIDKTNLFNEQSKIIKKINTSFRPSIYAHFVPNYRDLATIYQIFNSSKLPIQTRIILEESLIKSILSKKQEKKNEEQSTSKLVYNKFIEKFNSHYSRDLLKEQQQLMKKYILSSFNDIDFKIYLNEEIQRLKSVVESSLSMNEVSSDKEMTTKMNEVIQILEGYKEKQVDTDMIQEILKIQNLAQEITSKE
jgi:hypothetical protein